MKKLLYILLFLPLLVFGQFQTDDVLNQSKSSSDYYTKVLTNRASQSGGVTVDRSASVNSIRSSSINLGDDVTKRASLIYTPLSYGGGTNYSVFPKLNNLLMHSEDFTQSVWNKNFTTIISNAVVSPIGVSNGTKLVATATSNVHNVFQSITNEPTNTSHISSSFVKKYTGGVNEYRYSYVEITYNIPTVSRYVVVVDLQTGVVTDTKLTGSMTRNSYLIEDYDTYWRISVSGTTASSTSTYLQVGVSDVPVPTYSSGEPLMTGDGVSGIFIWGTQIERGVLTTYQKTTSVQLNSDFNFTRSTTATVTNKDGSVGSVSSNYPRLDYSLDSTKPSLLIEPQRTNLLLNSATGTTQNVTVSAQLYTLSFYGTGSYTLSGVFSGTLTGVGSNNRVFLSFTPTAGTLTLTVSGSVTMAQLEAGNPTSWIPTTTTTLTRNGETSFIDLSNNNLLNKNNFTLYWEGYSYYGMPVGTATPSVCLSDTSTTLSNTNQIGWISIVQPFYNIGGAQTYYAGTGVSGGYNKFAIQYNNGVADFWLNGTKVLATQSVPIFDYRYLCVNNGGSAFTTSKVLLFKETLSDAQCLSLTL